MNINIDMNKAINDIAHKLGIAVEKVYPMLYKQAIIEGAWSIMWVVISIITAFLIRKWLKWLGCKIEKDDSSWSDYSDHIMAIGFLCLLTPIVFFINIKDAINIFFNTDYYIINQIITKALEVGKL